MPTLLDMIVFSVLSGALTVTCIIYFKDLARRRTRKAPAIFRGYHG